MEPVLHSFDWMSFALHCSDNIVIDAGHVALGMKDGCVYFGREATGPSETETKTLRYAFEIATHLTNYGKSCSINLCFSDTSKNFQTTEQRKEIKERIFSSTGLQLLPLEYRELIEEYPSISVRLSLQTQNSNQFTARIKQVKTDIRRLADLELIYERYSALFLRDTGNDLFGFTHPFLLNHHHEDSLMGGTWWLEESNTLHPSDISRCPFLPLKKLGIVNLHTKSAGILCPGTYAGLLLGLPDNADRIAVYSRADDELIAEKILRGVITAYTFNPSLSCRTLTVTLPVGFSEVEFSEVSRELLMNSKPTWPDFYSQIEEMGLMSNYVSYTHLIGAATC